MSIQEAFKFHRAGRLAEAEALYRQILQTRPGHPDALHLLGMVAHETGRNELAVELIGQAIKVNPSAAMYHNNLAMALEALGKMDEAAASFSKALLLKPGYAKAHFNLGNILRGQGKFDSALASFHNAILYQPDYAEAHNNLGNVLKDLGKLDEAVLYYRKSLSFKSGYAEAHNNLGNVLKDQGKPDEAVGHFNEAIIFQPDYAEAYCNLGNALKDLKQFDAALLCYSKAIALKPDYADAYNNRGNVLKDLKQFDAALASYDQAIAIKPAHADTYNNRGVALHELKHFNAALASFDQAIAIKPDHADAYNNRGVACKTLNYFDAALESFDQAISIDTDHADAYNNRGNVLRDQGRLDVAVEHFHKSLSIKPDFIEAHYNLGNTFVELKQPDAAFASYDQAIAIKPDYADGHWNKALLFLLLGDFENGWAGYEWRWENKNLEMPKRNFAQPLWLGAESLAGKSILLHSEQGLGDAIQFCRYAKMVADCGAHVILEVQEPILDLMANLDGVSQLVASGDSLPAFDLHCPLLSLPLAFKTGMDSIPAATPYLRADAGKVAQWKVKLDGKAGPRAGLVWRGSALHTNDRNRSISFAELLHHLPDGFQYVSLQKELRGEDQETLRSRPDILHFGDELTDFSDTAALCELMDVIISVDTSVAHLAGALGKPVWILLPYIPDWRWLLDRSDSPWYPGAKLYRQEKIGEWDAVFEKVKSDLLSLVPCTESDPVFDRDYSIVSMANNLLCPVCQGACALLDVVDFNKTCEEARGKFLTLSGIPVYYALCGKCAFCYAPELVTWNLEEFEQRIYNDEYILVDPDYMDARPRENAASLIAMFGDRAHGIKHLDYGGGGGLLVNLLGESNWQSASYDPFVDRDVRIEQLGTFDLITAFEVFEHVPDVRQLMSNLRTLLAPNGIVLFSTLLSDGNIHPKQRISWWYASPRNGHISLFSKNSLAIVAQNNGFNLGSFSEGFHAFFTQVPPWADHIISVS